MTGATVAFWSVLLLLGKDPSLEWRSLRTEHMNVHYHVEVAEVAERSAQLGEAVITTLEGIFGRPLDQRIELVVVDDQDAPNGLTRTVPYNHVVLYPYPPGSRSNLANYDDWLFILIAHEFTHVFQLEHAPGLWRVLNTVFGRTFQPGHMHPSWMTEGFAVLMESLLSGRGRVGFGPFEAVLRAQLLEDEAFDLGQISGPVILPPRGRTPYLYGEAFFSWIVDRYGLQALIGFFDSYDRWWIPLFHDYHARDAFEGHSWPALYEAWLAETAGSLDRLKERDVTGQRVTSGGDERRFPIHTPRGVIHTHATGHDETRIVRLESEDQDQDQEQAQEEVELYRCRGGCGRLSWDRDADRLFFERGAVHRLTYLRQDLFELDLRAGGLRQITHGARVHDPSWCPNQAQVVAARTVAGSSSLVMVEPTTGEVTELLSLAPGVQISDPTCALDGRAIYFSAPIDGSWDIWRLNLAKNTRSKLTDDTRVERDLSVVRGTGQLLYSVTDSEGVARVRLLDPDTGRARFLTMSRTADLWPSWDGPGSPLLFARQEAGSIELYRQEPVVETGTPTTARRPRASDATAWPRPAIVPSPAPAGAQASYTPSRYCPFPSILPRAWTPTWLASSDRLLALGVELRGEDAIGHHAWSLAGDYDLQAEVPSALASYSWMGTWPSFTVSTFLTRRADQAWYNDAVHRWPRWFFGGSLGAFFTLPTVDDRWSFSLRYAVTQARFIEDRQAVDYQPDSTEPSFPGDARNAEIYASVGYDSRKGSLYGIASERGFSAHGSTAWRDMLLGGDTRLVLMRGSLSVPVLLPWPRHTVLNVHYRAGTSFPDPGFDGVYSMGGTIFTPVLQQLINQEFVGDVGLRGYAPGVQRGRHYQRLISELFVPIAMIYRGWRLIPVSLRKVYAKIIFDAGHAFTRIPFDNQPLTGVAGEIVTGVDLLYDIHFNVVTGYAHGLSALGGGLWYVYLGL